MNKEGVVYTHIHTMEQYLAIKKNKMPFAVTWMELEILILSKDRKKNLLYDTAYMWNLKQKK